MRCFRYVILGIGVCCLTAICSNYSVINFTFICMTEDVNDTVQYDNGTRQRFDYSPTEKSYIFWALAVGTIVGTFPINYLYVLYGARIPFFVAGMLSALATVFTPLAAYHGLPYLLGVRLIQGLAYAADFAAIGLICVRWAPLYQISTFVGLLTCFSPISTSVTNPVSGALCSTLGWRWAFYLHAVFCVIVFSLWLWLYSDDPQDHSMVSDEELAVIQKDKTKGHIERDRYVPYWKIMKSPVVLVVWANAFTELVTTIILFTYSPIYIKVVLQVLGYSIATTSVLASIGSAVHVPVKMTASILSDQLRCVSEKAKMCFFNTVSVGLAGIVCGLVGLAPTEWLAVAAISSSCILIGFNSGGFYKCGTLHTRQYAHFVLATIQFCKCIALFVGPFMVSSLTNSDDDAVGWRNVFLLNAGLNIVTNCIFYPMCTDQPADFTKGRELDETTVTPTDDSELTPSATFTKSSKSS